MTSTSLKECYKNSLMLLPFRATHEKPKSKDFEIFIFVLKNKLHFVEVIMVNINYGEQVRGLFKVFSREQMYVLLSARDAGCTEEQIDFLANPSFSSSLMHEFLNGIKGGVSLEQLNQYTKFEYKEIAEIIEGLVTDKLSREQVGIYAKELNVSNKSGLQAGLIS